MVPISFSGVYAHLDHRTWDTFKADDGSDRPAGESFNVMISAHGTLYKLKLREEGMASLKKLSVGDTVLVRGMLKARRDSQIYIDGVTLEPSARTAAGTTGTPTATTTAAKDL